MNIASILDEWALRTPSGLAIIDEGNGAHCTYAELRDRAAALSRNFAQAGLQPGDRVLVGVPMCLELYVALVAIWRSGLVAVVPDASSDRAQIDRAVDLVKPRALVVSQRFAPLVFALRSTREIPLRFVFGRFPLMRRIERDAVAVPEAAIIQRSAADPALITFTSGSTGVPKAAVRSHAVLHAQLQAILSNVRLGGMNLDLMPIVLLANLAAGGTSVIPEVNLRSVGRADPSKLAATIQRHGCTSMVASPAVLERLAGCCARNDPRLASLADVYSGGAPVFPVVLDRFSRIAPNARLHAVYGSTEAEPIAHLQYSQISAHDRERMRDGGGLLVGSVDASSDVRIVAGEIVVAGGHVVPGYLDGIGDAETKVLIADTIFHRTGDAGHFDAQGRLWLLGRVSAVIDDARGTLYPLTVECAASFIEGVRRSAAVQSAQGRTLFVEGKLLDVQGARAKLTWAGLDQIVEVRAIPVDRRHNAKVDYPKLRKMAARC